VRLVCGYCSLVDANTTQKAPLTTEEKLRRAQEAYREFRAQCFWFMRKDLIVTERNLPLVIEGLRLHGGHKGWNLAATLCP
jgi:hypothetical protein